MNNRCISLIFTETQLVPSLMHTIAYWLVSTCISSEWMNGKKVLHSTKILHNIIFTMKQPWHIQYTCLQHLVIRNLSVTMADANTLSSAESTQLWQVPQCIDFTFIGISRPGEEAICSVIHIKRLSYDRMKEIPLKKIKREFFFYQVS